MNNMNQMMKQVKKMQEQMLKAQEELADKTVQGTSGGGVVTAEVNGHKNCFLLQSSRKLLIRMMLKCFKTLS